MLGRTVRSVDAVPVGEGQMGASWRLALTYDGADEPGPATLVAKLAGGDPAARAQVAVGFAKEVGFYADVAPVLEGMVPDCWYWAITDDGADFTLLLEDLAPSVPGVQVDGCTFEEAVASVRNLAAIHASTWCDRAMVDLAFLDAVDAQVAELFGAAYSGAVERFIDRYAAALGDEDVATLRAVATVMAGWLADRPEPFALLHGDYRSENLMFGLNGANVVALDWQSVSVGPPGRDLAYFLGNSLEIGVRRQQEDEIVAAYHAELLAWGVTGYDLAHCAEDYRAGHLQGPLITVLGAIYATAERSERADRMFEAMATRSCAAIRDCGSLDLVG